MTHRTSETVLLMSYIASDLGLEQTSDDLAAIWMRLLHIDAELAERRWPGRSSDPSLRTVPPQDNPLV
jgi:hypothetical protein